MAEATHTSEAMYSLLPGHGTGRKLWAGKITVSDGETLDTGLDTIEGCAFTEVEATDGDANSLMLFIDAISGGVITFLTGKIGDYADLTDHVAYGIVVGNKR